MLKINKRESGKQSEHIAVKFLEKKGYRIIERNYFKRCGEIDIIAEIDGEIVFVEVKSLSSEYFLNIYDTISNKKRIRLIKTAKVWLCRNHKYSDNIFRIDFIGIVLKGGNVDNLLHIKNAIY